MTRGWLAFACISLLLPGCGFHLRGSGVKASVTSAYVHAAEGIDVTNELIRALGRSGVRLVDNPAEAAVEIDLLEQQQNTRTLSYTDRATTAESQLELGVRFKIVNAEKKVLIDDHWARATRTYLVDTNNLVGSNQQAGLMHEELVSDVAQQVVRSLNAATRQAH